MHMTESGYGKLVKGSEPKSPKFKDLAAAFVIGGLICVLGQILLDLYMGAGLSETEGGTLVSITLILLAQLLTGLGIFDSIAKFAGAGTLVPITGFANAIVSPAIEYKKEGLITGLGVKMFSIAGPVLVYGTLAGAIYGAIYYIALLF